MALLTVLEKLQLKEEKNVLIQGLPSSIEKQFVKLSFAKNVTPLLKSKKINGNKIYEKIVWDISNIIFKKDKYYLKFTLFNSSLFSFKYY